MQIKDLRKEILQIKRKNKDEYKKPEPVQDQDQWMQLLIKAASDKKLKSKIPGLLVEEDDAGSDEDEKN